MSCPDCLTGAVLAGEPSGHIVDGAYFAPSPNAGSSKEAIVLLTDIFGLALKNPKVLADRYAATLGCDTYVPDLFNGNPPFTEEQLKSPERAGEHFPLRSWVWMFIKVLHRIPALWTSRPSVGTQRAKQFIDKIKQEKKYEKIGAIGFCYGGTICKVRLGAEQGYVHSLVINHPGGFPAAMVPKINVGFQHPGVALKDFSFGDSVRLRTEAEFKKREGKEDAVDYEFKVYKGVVHGFACRPNQEYKEVLEGYEGAFEQGSSWFKKTILS